MTSNFAFLASHWPDLSLLGSAAELHLFSDPAETILLLGKMSRRIAWHIALAEKLKCPRDTEDAELIRLLRRTGLLPKRIDGLLYSLRRISGAVSRGEVVSADQSGLFLSLAYHLSVWFAGVYGDADTVPEPFRLPEAPEDSEEFQALCLEQRAAVEELAEPSRVETEFTSLPRSQRLNLGKEQAEAIVLSEGELQHLAKEKIRLEPDTISVVNYALHHNRVPIVRSLTVIHNDEQPMEHLELHITSTPELCLPCSKHIDFIPGSSVYDIRDIKLLLNTAYLAGLTEKCTGVLHFALTKGDTVICREDLELTALAFDQWHGYSLYPELLTAFVTPNHPAIAQIISRAGDFLGEWTGDPSLDAYQTEDPNRVLTQAAAVYAALQEQNILYAVSPASFERVGQRVRLCDSILNQKLGTCLDLTLFYASCLEAIGLHPILILQKGHIFAGVWLEDMAFPESVLDDVSLLTKRMSSGINEIAVCECTLFTAGSSAPFSLARSTAEQKLMGTEPIEFFIDVNRARLSGILPLPQRVLDGDRWQVIRPDVDPRKLTGAPDGTMTTIDIGDPNAAAPMTKQTQWERKLLDLGLRNQLINMRLTKTMLPLLTVSLEELENALSSGKDFSILPRPGDWTRASGQVDFETMHDLGGLDEVIQSEFKNHRLRSAYSDTELSKTIKELYRSSKTALEENGANTLYLALGLLRWYETPKSTKPRYAPVVLLPVDIIRKSAAQGYVIRLRDDEAQMNITMLEKMKQDFQLLVNGLDPLPTDEQGIDIRKVFAILRKAVMGQARWDVLELACLGVFSFSQFVMWNDIRNRSEDLKRNKIVRSLMEGRLAWDAKPMEIGSKVPEEGVFLPLPADASQLFAIENASQGESFVLHGPPGTGKSQTITAMIANALAQDKTVLFVAEKMAALEVVQKRLEAIGIGAFCLELHSNKSKKRNVLEQLRRATEVTRSTPPEIYAQKAGQLAQLRGELDVYAEALHKPLECGMTVYQLINRYEQLRHVPNAGLFRHRDVDGLTGADLDLRETVVSRLVAAGKAVGHPKDHPLSHVGCTRYAQTLRQELPGTISAYRAAIYRLERAVTDMTGNLCLTVPATHQELAELRNLAEVLQGFLAFPRAWSQTDHLHLYLEQLCQTARSHMKTASYRSQLLRNWTESFLTQNAGSLSTEWNTIQNKWFLAKNMETNKMLKRLAPFSRVPVDKDSLSQQFALLAQYQSSLAESRRLLDQTIGGLGHLYAGEATDWNGIIQLTDQARFADERLRSLGAPEEYRRAYAGDPATAGYLAELCRAWDALEAPRAQVQDLLALQDASGEVWTQAQLRLCDSVESHASELKEWITWNAIAGEAESLGLAGLVKVYVQGAPHEDIPDLYHKSLYQALSILEIGRDEALNAFSGSVFDEKIAQLIRLDAQITDLTRQEIFCRLASRIPNFSKEAAHSSEVGILQRAIRSGGRGISIRKLFEQIPNLLPRLCPCMLMSPISAAQYLDPGWEPFHIVVFDEASQLTTSKAVGALARGRDAIIVGDPKQMPPTSFFATNTVDEENLDTEDLESILDDCLAMNMPQTHLLWHYRSRHESLIAFSNSRFYENKLYTFPSVNDREKKVRLVSVDGVFERGKNRCNRAEAEAIVEEIRRRCHDPELSGRSVGVVTFNISQQNLIDDLLTEACRTDPDLEKWALESEEPVFIKNLENVQGDERDVILFSIGYGPDEKGKVYMNFGPLNREGGWRRLNVAVSRSRQEMVVFSTLTPEQINLSKTSALGVAALKEFLEYAGGKELPQTEHTANVSVTRNQGIAEAICAYLASRGYDTDRNVGHSEYRIDVGVIDPENPEQYLLGILLDGEAYGSAKTTRDREIAQIGVLNGLGWKIHRLWSMDWWDNREKELERITQILTRILETREAERILAEEAAEAGAPTETPETPEAEIPQTPAEDTALQTVEQAEPKKLNARSGGKRTESGAVIYKTAVLRPLTLQPEDFMLPRYNAPLQSRVNKVLEAEAPISEGLLIRRIVQSCGITRSGSRIHNRMKEILNSMNLTVTEQDGLRFYWRKDQNPEQYGIYRISDREETKREAKDIPVEEAAAAVLMTLYEQGGLIREDLVRESAKLMGYTRLGSVVTPLFENAIFYAEDRGFCMLDNNGRWALTDEGIHLVSRRALPGEI